MSKTDILFLETTIQANRIFGENDLADKIERNLNGKRVCTSIFVMNEFKKTFLEAVICYYNLLVDSPDTHTALRRVTKSYSNRLPKRVIHVYAKVCDEVGYDKEAILERLEAWIEDDLMIEFHENVEEPIVNKTACCRVGEPVKKGNKYELKIACAKDDPPPCKIENFWKEHKGELHRLASATSFEDSELNKVRDAAVVIKKGTDKPYGNNCHVHLSDAVIAIESPNGSQIYTTNKKHFEPICKVIENREVYKEV